MSLRRLMDPYYFGSPAYRAEMLRQRIFSTRIGMKIAVAVSRYCEKHPNSKIGRIALMATIPF